MYPTLPFIFLLFFQCYFCHDLNELFEEINQKTVKFNHEAAKIAWESSINPGNPELPTKAANHQKKIIKWQQNVCDKLVALNNGLLLNETQRRQTYLLCRGPRFTFDEAREISYLYEELQSMYSDVEICIPHNATPETLPDIESAILNYLAAMKRFSNSEQRDSVLLAAKMSANGFYEQNTVFCLNGEEDVEKLMKYSRNEVVLRFLWFVWREKVGPQMKEPYKELVDVENRAARRNGYTDIGESWRDDQEIPNLRQFCRQLYSEVKPFYDLLHGVVRFFLRRHYGDIVPKNGPIPAHLLGNLWAQNWEALSDLIIPRTINLDESIHNLNWTVLHMVKRAEDFYQSLGLPPMSDAFWRESIFSRRNPHMRCHGTAADMFKEGDYRLLYCSGTSAEDFYVLHHEMGHIQYYMAYEQQPGIFRQANAALHETIGDTIMYGVMTPQHLNRLGLVNDSLLYTANLPEAIESIEIEPIEYQGTNELGLDSETQDSVIDDGKDDEYFGRNSVELTENDEMENINEEDPATIDNEKESLFQISTDDILLLKLALSKLPQIPFALLIDEYRWRYFEGQLNGLDFNDEFWTMALELQGVAPPRVRDEGYFDAGAKFHVPDNTPYIRYFLSSFLQHQLFESLCKTAVFGRRDVTEDLPRTITMGRCDIYGSKAVGKLLKDLMSRGNSQNWREILLATIGQDNISTSALKRYYQPLYKLLQRLIRAHRIPIGW